MDEVESGVTHSGPDGTSTQRPKSGPNGTTPRNLVHVKDEQASVVFCIAGDTDTVK